MICRARCLAAPRDARGTGSASPWDEMPGPLLGITPRHSGIGKPRVIGRRRIVGMGWQPDVPDLRDRLLDSNEIVEVTKGSGSLLDDKSFSLPKRHNRNIQYCSPVEDQESLGSCTANAVVGMMEYLQRRGGIIHINLSRLFLYKVTRNLLGWTGDTGAYIRSTLQATAAFGIPPEANFPYDIDAYEAGTRSVSLCLCREFQGAQLRSPRQGPNIAPEDLLTDLKRVICAGHVVPLRVHCVQLSVERCQHSVSRTIRSPRGRPRRASRRIRR